MQDCANPPPAPHSQIQGFGREGSRRCIAIQETEPWYSTLEGHMDEILHCWARKIGLFKPIHFKPHKKEKEKKHLLIEHIVMWQA